MTHPPDSYLQVMGVDLPRMVRHIAGLHGGNISEAFAQFAENGFDAGADRVWIHLTPDMIAITDGGHGMVERISPQDAAIIARHQQLPASSRGDIRLLMSRPSLCSLERMMTQIARSSKLPGTDPKVAGMMGLGFWSWLLLGGRVRVITSPDEELTRLYYLSFDTSPAWELIPPSAADLANGSVTFTTRLVAPTLLRTPSGVRLSHGTRVEITELHPGVRKLLEKPGMLAAMLSTRLAGILESGHELVIVDQITEEGKKTRGGRTIPVLRPRTTGRCVFDQTLSTESGFPFRVFLYHDPSATNLYPVVTLGGNHKNPLPQLQGFNHSPWDRGQLGGTVAFPDYPNQDKLWDPSKQRPLPHTLAYDEWLTACTSIEADLTAAIEAKPSPVDATLRQLSSALVAATRETLTQSPVFSGVLMPDRSRARPKSSRGAKAKKEVPTTVIARVVNEHREGVEGVQVSLYLGDKRLDSSQTDQYGRVNFGRRRPGIGYILRLVLPSHAEPDGETEVTFDLINKVQEGITHTFHIVTHEPARVVKPVTGFQPVYRSMGPEVLWRELLHAGLIEYNIDHPALRTALERGDDKEVLLLLAQYTASAITQYSLSGPTQFILQERDKLALALLERLRASTHHAKRSRKKE